MWDGSALSRLHPMRPDQQHPKDCGARGAVMAWEPLVTREENMAGNSQSQWTKKQSRVFFHG